MNTKQRNAVLIGMAIVLAMWLFPPWIHGSGRGIEDAGYFFLFDMQQHNNFEIHRIDFGRLFAQNVVAFIVTTAAFIMLRPIDRS
jgi:hypothetical protein